MSPQVSALWAVQSRLHEMSYILTIAHVLNALTGQFSPAPPQAGPAHGVVHLAPVGLTMFAPPDVIAGVRSNVEIGIVDAQKRPMAAIQDIDINLVVRGTGYFVDGEALAAVPVSRVRLMKDTFRARVNFVHTGPTGAQTTLIAEHVGGALSGVKTDIHVRAGGPSGSLDTAFGGGAVFYSIAVPPYDSVHAISHMGSDGTLFVATTDQNPSLLPNLAVRKFLPDLTPDVSFGIAGVLHPIPAGDLGLWDFQLAPDGRLVLCMWDANPAVNLIYVLRLNADGSPDNSFGSGVGLPVALAFAWWDPAGDSKVALAVAPDSSILALFDGLDVVKLNPSGSVDASFGSSGVVHAAFGPSPWAIWPPNTPFYDQGRPIAVQPDGRILVANYRLTRLQANGSVDMTFGASGLAPSASQYDLSAASIALQPDGRILVAGAQITTSSSPVYDRRVMRYLADGALDPSFGSQGTADNQWLESMAEVDWSSARLSLSSSGKIALATDSFRLDGPTYGHHEPTLLRWNADGTVDSSWGHAGRMWLKPSDGGTYKGVQLNLRNDGSAVAVAAHQIQSASFANRLALLPLRLDGNRDGSINGDGLASINRQGSVYFTGVCMTPAADGGLFAAAWRQSTVNPNDFGLAVHRLRGDGMQDVRFADFGELYIPGANQPYNNQLLALDDVSRLVVLHTWFFGSAHATVRRYLPDGAPDPNFGNTGVSTLGFSGTVAARGVVVDPLQRATALVAVAGHAIAFRLTENGQLDSTFGNGGLATYSPHGPQSYYLPSSIAVDRRGRSLLSGNFTAAIGYDRWLCRASKLGLPDSSFGVGGETITDEGGWTEQWASMAIRCDRRVLVGGIIYGNQLAVIALVENGSRDTAFGVSGLATLPAPLNQTNLSSLDCLPDGSSVLGHPGFFVTKLAAAGFPDLSFANLGQLQVPVAGAEPYGPSICVSRNGTIFAATNCAGALTVAHILP